MNNKLQQKNPENTQSTAKSTPKEPPTTRSHNEEIEEYSSRSLFHEERTTPRTHKNPPEVFLVTKLVWILLTELEQD